MIYILCIPHKRALQYVEIIGVYLNKNIALEKMAEFNANRIFSKCTIKVQAVTKSLGG